MSHTMIEKIITETLRQYMNLNEDIIDRILVDPNFFVKELVQRINNLEVLIFSNGHEPHISM